MFKKFLILISISISLLACNSKSPETAIIKMKAKADEYMLKGKKPTLAMVVADCSDAFIEDHNSNIEWKSKLEVFETEFEKHVEEKNLFDSSKSFPNTVLSISILDNIADKPDSIYYYHKTHTTISGVAPLVINMTSMSEHSTPKNIYPRDKKLTEFIFLEKNKYNNNVLAVSSSSVITDIDTSVFTKMQIAGSCVRTTLRNENVYFYDPKTHKILDFPQDRYSRLVYNNLKNGGKGFSDLLSIFNEDPDNQIELMINEPNGKTIEDKLLNLVPGHELLVWEEEYSKANGYQSPVFDKCTVKGQISLILIEGYLHGVYLTNASIVSKEDACLKFMKPIKLR